MGEGTQILNESVEQSVEIYAIDGRLVKQHGFNPGTIDVSGLNSGVYVMKVMSGDGQEFYTRVVKE